MPTWWGVTQLGWQGVAALSSLGTLIVASLAAWFGKSQLDHARRVREDQIRPYMVADIESSDASRQIKDLVIRNIGSSPAYNVRVEVDPAPQRSNEDPEHLMADAGILNNVTRMFAPGREFRMVFDSMIDRKIAGSHLPREYTAKVSYYRDSKCDSRDPDFVEEFFMSFDFSKDAPYATVYTLHDLVKELKASNEQWERIARAVFQRWDEDVEGVTKQATDVSGT